MAYLSNTSVNGDLGVSGLTSVGSAGLKFTSGIINIFGSSNSGGTGTSSISIGNGAAATGSYSVALGFKAQASKTETVAIGDEANTSGSNSIAIGYEAEATGDSNGVAIGFNAKSNYSNSIAIGPNTSGPSSAYYTRIGGSYGSTGRALLLGNGYTSFTWMNGAGSSWQSASDKRDKINIEPIQSALDFILKLKPVTYNMNPRESYRSIDEQTGDTIFDQEGYSSGTKKAHRRVAGLVAQDAYDAMIETYNDDNYADLIDWSGYDHPEEIEKNEDQYSIQYERYIPFLIKAIQEQNDIIKNQSEQIEFLKKEINKSREE